MKSKLALVGLCLTLGASASTSGPQQQAVVAPPSGEPAGIAGLSADSLKAAFGEPTFMRHDGVTQLWRYDGQACHAFFFLYDQGGVATVRHVETLPRGATMAADTTCLDALRARAKVS